MNLFYAQNVICTIGLVFCMIGVIGVARRSSSEEQKLMLIIEFAGLLVLISYWGEMQSPNNSRDLLIFSLKLRYLGLCIAYVGFMLVARYYYKFNIPKVFYWGQILSSLFFVVVTLTFDEHKLFYRSFYVEKINGVNRLIKNVSVLYLVHISYLFVYVIVFTIMFFKSIKNRSHPKKDFKLGLYLYIAVIIPIISFASTNIFHFESFIPTPIAITVSSLICLYLISNRKFFDVNYIAQVKVIDSIEDAIIVVDSSYCLISKNTTSVNVFPCLSKFKKNKQIKKCNEYFDKVFTSYSKTKKNKFDDYIVGEKVYCPEIKEIFDDLKNIQGYILCLHDVTGEREKENILRNYNDDLKRQVISQTYRLANIQDEMIRGFSTLAEDHNLTTGKHIRRISSYTWVIATEMQQQNIYPEIVTDSWIESLRKLSPLHDIGKISITDAILDKPSSLTHDEFEIMKTHTVLGSEIIKTIMKNNDKNDVELASDIAKYHHEWWNGKGYLDGLSGLDIPLSARIMAVADVFDAVVSKRPYKQEFTLEQAFDIIKENTGTQFDPQVVKAFLDSQDRIIEVYEELKD